MLVYEHVSFVTYCSWDKANQRHRSLTSGWSIGVFPENLVEMYGKWWAPTSEDQSLYDWDDVITIVWACVHHKSLG